MNLLTHELPTAVEIDGAEVAINTDFRDALRVILAFEDDELVAVEKRLVLLSSLYAEPPQNMMAAFEQGVKFLNGGEVPDPDDEPGPRLYSFEQDARFIFAAFRATHGLDLSTVELHWWAFLALFFDLGQDTTFCQLVALRKRVKSGKASKEEKQAAREMGDVFELAEPDTRTAEEREREAEFMRIVEGGKRKRAEVNA